LESGENSTRGKFFSRQSVERPSKGAQVLPSNERISIDGRFVYLFCTGRRLTLRRPFDARPVGVVAVVELPVSKPRSLMMLHVVTCRYVFGAQTATTRVIYGRFFNDCREDFGRREISFVELRCGGLKTPSLVKAQVVNN
jgi:hypothetical protein